MLRADRPPGAAGDAPEIALDIRDLRRTFLPRHGRPLEALAGVSLSVHQGEVVAVLGPSGCGKSSLLRILAGLDGDYSGEISWSLAGKERDADRRLLSATVFQSDSTFPWLTIERNLRVGLSGLRLDAGEIEARIARYLRLVGLGRFRASYPHELSGGMRQRVAIARALAAEPRLLLMDEPLAALDAQTRLVMQQELLRIWRETRSTVVYITHDIGEALMLADRVVVMTARPGRIKLVQSVPFSRDREAIETRANPEFGRLESMLWRSVAEEVGHSLDSAGGAS
jgi:ABC-type nitrate/sulfonate/bicarbonate transport system ATPase subunit